MSTFTLSGDTEEIEKKDKKSEVTSQNVVAERMNNVGYGDTDAPVVQPSETTRDSGELVLETQMEKDEEKAIGPGGQELSIIQEIGMI
ncbi:hypothetical protein K7X08_017504 [Anisodus acutangulus]|uniref:Uncharacterized protein n=1 Tax=Anisodus acutangulus TaxID=402998 RepID=A0A9Q1R9M6_9SOLA|nr:hypothetical protein K7X08_017504 [Anisodus acutangulus]